jgi:hypothetical protein
MGMWQTESTAETNTGIEIDSAREFQTAGRSAGIGVAAAAQDSRKIGRIRTSIGHMCPLGPYSLKAPSV